MNKILFIRGFRTNNIKSGDTYANILIVLNQNENNDVEYFNYSMDENIVKVYKRLQRVIKNDNFTHLIGHSMGGGLLVRYMYDHPDDISRYKHVMLLMPLLYKTPFNKFFFNIPLVRRLSLPNAFVLASSKAYSTGNILNDGFKYSKLQQPADMYNKIMLEADEFVDVLNENRNTVIFYAREEGYTMIPKTVLKKIKNKVYVNGLHECFNSLETVKEFFEKFLPYFD
jgi:pimeloyl-ACP methyl ester carboxylesterase